MNRCIIISVLLMSVFSGCLNKPGHREVEKERISDENRVLPQANINSSTGIPSLQLHDTDMDRAVPDISPTLSPNSPIPALNNPSPPPAADRSAAPVLPLEQPQPQSIQMPSSQPKRTATNTPKPIKPFVAVQKTKQKQLSLSELYKKYPDYFKINGSFAEKKIAFTFDDGPDLNYTPQILDVLKKNDIKATFFLVGSRCEANPDMVRRIVNEGHTVGNHFYNHPNPAKLNSSEFEQQIEQTQIILRNIIGYSPKLIRPPYGAINEEQLQWTGTHNFIVVNWDVDSLDWKQLSAQQVSANILESTHGGSIILQHSAGGSKQNLSGTVQALPLIIQKLKDEGYEMVSVPQLLRIPKSK